MISMDSNFKGLEKRILEANKSAAYHKVQELIETINGNTIVIGTGGSYAVAEYIKKCLNCYAAAIKPREIFFQKLNFVNNIILVTYSGRSVDIMQCINYCKNYKNINKIFVITRDGQYLREKTDLDERLSIIEYKNKDTREKSFISLASTLAPASLFARYFIEKNEINFAECIKSLTNGIQKEIYGIQKKYSFEELLTNPVIEIIYECETESSAAVLESNFSEAGIAYSVLHEKKHYSHGRYVLQYSKNTPIIIWLKNSSDSSYDKLLLKYLNKHNQTGNLLVLRSSENGIIGEFEMVLKSMYITKTIAEKVGIDISKINYPKDGSVLYHFDSELI